MKLYDFKPAPNPLRLNLFLAEKGIEIPSEQINLMKGAQFSGDYKTVNPMMTVPTLVLDDGTVLTEVVSMYSYLEEQHPDNPLMGNTALERAQVLSWDHRCFNEGIIAIAEIFRNTSEAFVNRAIPGPTPCPQIAELAERGQTRAAAFYQVLESHLKGREYMVGEAFSAADIAAFVFVHFGSWVKIEIPEDCESVQAWHDRISQRPAFVQCFAEIAQ